MALSRKQSTAWVRNPVVYSLAALFMFIVFLYGFNGNTEQVDIQGRSAIRWMTSRWSGNVATDMSLGWLIPLVSLYAAWLRRASLLKAELAPDWRGIFAAMLAFGLYWVGSQGGQTRITLLSLILLLWSIPFAFWGWGVARQLIFPVGYLIFCVPMSFLDSLTFPLRLLTAAISTGVLNGLGLETARTGTAMHSAVAGGFSFEIADPCSGLRSVLAMTALTAAFSYFTMKGPVRRLLLFLSAVPLAVAGNIVRLVMIGLVALAFGQDKALGFYHDYSGYVFFFAATAFMVGASALINRDWKTSWSTVRSKLHAAPRA